ncbi:helix-turn-helix domain-containing protein [Streptomyces indicus]|uniref:Helix-turn-helix domain-containing protein n=1 Tax=Streptomyces indicus TaxID=417292 RepID=A0A1G9EGB4_9ACTN|nr:helix-turn-helix transcriptional regulator [Streptomyces indicus]SDK75128.1 Helix-turn-helix domain-containing protein [Streptomyces indicus]
MGLWQPLPEELPAEVAHFVEQLRLLKDRTGLSLVALGKRTSYSKSSWQRYLNGQQPPPRKAVLALCKVANLDAAEAARCGARWELAVRAWPKPETGENAGGEPPAEGATGTAPGWSDLDPGEDEDTLPWWVPQEEPEARPSQPHAAPPWRLFAYTAVTVIALLLAGLLFVVAKGA